MRKTLEDIYRRHRQALFSLALSVTECRGLAEDAVHDAFARLLRDADGRHLNGDPVCYVFRAVRNAAVDLIRHDVRQQRTAEAVFQATPAGAGHADSERAVSVQEQLQQLAEAIRQLPVDAREIVVLRTTSELTFEAIGDVLQIPAATAATRYRRALARLHGVLSIDP